MFLLLSQMQNKRVLHLFAAQKGQKPPRGASLFQAHFRGGERKGLFNLKGVMISVLHRELELKVEKLKNKKVGGHAAD